MDAKDYMFTEDSPQSEAIFSSEYTTVKLAYALADTISVFADNAERVQFLSEYSAGPGAGWFRGSITRALASLDVTVRDLNTRCS